jgi:hypothetical protein
MILLVIFVYLLILILSIAGRHIGGSVAHRIINGNYVNWWGGIVGFIKGSFGSLFALAPSLVLFWLLLGSKSLNWIAFIISAIYPAILSILSEKPDRTQIAYRNATIRGGIGISEPYSRDSFDNQIKELDEDVKREWLQFWGQLLGCFIIIAVAGFVWGIIK